MNDSIVISKIEVGDTIIFRSIIGLKERLLVEEIEGNLFKGRGIIVTGQQILTHFPKTRS